MEENDPIEQDKKPSKAKQWLKGNYMVIIFIILIMVLILILLSPLFTNLVGQKAPDFSLTSIDGEEFKLSDNFGKVIVLDIMRITCPACIEEMEHLRGIYNRYSPEDVMIITIDIESSDSNGDLMVFKSQHGDNWTFARDTDGVANKYRVSYIPTMVIIDRNGIIRYWGAGELSEHRLSQEIDELI
jgi:peroxiredoxin